jgi:hypothetical protein
MRSRDNGVMAHASLGQEPTSSRDENLKPLAVSPKVTGRLLSCGHQKVYDLIAAGELLSFIDADGRARKILMSSVEGYIARRLDAARKGDGLKSPVAAANTARAAKRQHGGKSQPKPQRNDGTESEIK